MAREYGARLSFSSGWRMSLNKSFETDTQPQGAAKRVGDRTPRGALPLCATRLQRGHQLKAALREHYSVVTSGMSELHFEWDQRKAAANENKHGVTFEEAKSMFSDERAKLIDDPDHSDDEARFILLGSSRAFRVLVICHCYREEGNVIRIISVEKRQPGNRGFIGKGAVCAKSTISLARGKIPMPRNLKNRSPFVWTKRPLTISNRSRTKLASLTKA
jgi:hypothetical protein